MVKTFEFNYELGWNVMKDYLQSLVGVVFYPAG